MTSTVSRMGEATQQLDEPDEARPWHHGAGASQVIQVFYGLWRTGLNEKPELKQFADLTVQDFAKHPIWLNCHVADYDEPWYDETDEETFRPWTGRPPADPSAGMLLLRASVVLRDGSQYPGFVSPAADGDIGTMQPQIFVGKRLFRFWGGGPGVPEEHRRAFYVAIGKAQEAIFPLRVFADEGLVQGPCEVQVEGFYRTSDLKRVEIER